MAKTFLNDKDELKVTLPRSVFKTGRMIQGKKPARILAWIMEEGSSQRTVGQYKQWRRDNGLSGENDGLGNYLLALIKKGIVKAGPHQSTKAITRALWNSRGRQD